MAVNDILSVYRQSLAGARQTRLAELQLSMQALQFEAAQEFREEGRQREDFVNTLNYANQQVSEAMSVDASNIYSKLFNMTDAKGKAVILRDDEGNLKKPSKSLNNLVEIGFEPQEANDIYNVVQMYQTAQRNPKSPSMGRAAEMAAVSIGRRFSRDYELYKRKGYSDSAKSEYLKAMEKTNVLFSGDDSFQKDLSVDSFIGAAEALGAQINIEKERLEMGEGDYTIDTPVSATGIREQSDEQFYANLFKKGEEAIINKPIVSTEAIEVDIAAPNFLENLQISRETDLEDTKSKIANSLNSLEALSAEKSNIKFAKRRGSIASSEAVDQLKEISDRIKDAKSQVDSLKTLEKEQKQDIKQIKGEKGQREFSKQFEVLDKITSQYRF